jgi:hypothetical protein
MNRSPGNEHRTRRSQAAPLFNGAPTRFAASPSVIGKNIQINGTSFTIAGVTAPDFYGVSPDVKPSVFLPMANIGLTRPQQDSKAMFHEPKMPVKL